MDGPQIIVTFEVRAGTRNERTTVPEAADLRATQPARCITASN